LTQGGARAKGGTRVQGGAMAQGGAKHRVVQHLRRVVGCRVVLGCMMERQLGVVIGRREVLGYSVLLCHRVLLGIGWC